MLGGAIDRQGHVFQSGNWIYATLTGDGWLREIAKVACGETITYAELARREVFLGG